MQTMAKYDPKSLHAEEFINDEEIRATLQYAEENKNNAEHAGNDRGSKVLQIHILCAHTPYNRKTAVFIRSFSAQG